MLYRPDRIASTALPDWAVPIRPNDLWSDDPNDFDYNQMVRAPYPYSHERLTRADPQYDLILITDWNWDDPNPRRKAPPSSSTPGAAPATRPPAASACRAKACSGSPTTCAPNPG